MTSDGDSVELAEVIYNPKESKTDNNNETSIDHTYSFTVPQKPDIVLQLTRHDIETGFKLTYLFDAKYRIGQSDTNGPDIPPNDAINQMHRYRDALYYDPKQEGLPIKKKYWEDIYYSQAMAQTKKWPKLNSIAPSKK